jgi:IclR family pca regulon transcriptional regulator
VLLASQPAEMWPGILQNIPLTPMTDRTVTDRTAFRRVLEDTREKGWSLVDQELEKGLLSIAVALPDSAGRLVGAINVGVPAIRTTAEEMIRDILPRLQQTVASISQALKR